MEELKAAMREMDGRVREDKRKVTSERDEIDLIKKRLREENLKLKDETEDAQYQMKQAHQKAERMKQFLEQKTEEVESMQADHIKY